MMTTRQAIEICRAEAARNTGVIRQALTLCADVAQHHAERNYFVAGRTQTTVYERPPDLDAMSKAELRAIVEAFYAESFPATVLHADKPMASKDHPTMKPADLITRLVQNSTIRDGTVLDPFGGSGTTLIACEMTGRKCGMVEIDPRFCDVIRRRWAEFKHGENCDWAALTPEVTE